MRKQLAGVALIMLLFGGVGSSALLTHALAGSPPKHSAVHRLKHSGPIPTPRWYWRWAAWRLGEGYAKGRALEPGIRPRRAPKRIPAWAWHRLHFFLALRRHAAISKQGKEAQSTQQTPAANTTPSATTSAVTTTATPTPPTPSPGWTNVVDDNFGVLTSLPSHWCTYKSHDNTLGGNYDPAHVYVSGGYLHLLQQYESNGAFGAGWYAGAISLVRNAAGGCGGSPSPYPNSAVDSRLTVRMRLVETGGGTAAGHRNVLRWPDSGSSSTGGEEDMWESDVSTAGAYFHYGSGRVAWMYPALGLTQWHTYRFQRLNNVISIYIDDMTTPIHVYSGDSTTLPATIKHWVLQQQCPHAGCPAPSADTEDWQIASITVDQKT